MNKAVRADQSRRCTGNTPVLVNAHLHSFVSPHTVSGDHVPQAITRLDLPDLQTRCRRVCIRGSTPAFHLPLESSDNRLQHPLLHQIPIMAMPTPPPENGSDIEFNAKVLINAWFVPSTVSLSNAWRPNDIASETCRLAMEIMPLCSRTIVVNRESPVIPFLKSNEKGLAHGLPQLNLVDQRGETVCSFPLDTIFVGDFNARMAEMYETQTRETKPSDFQMLAPNQWTRFTYEVS
jgi:hypothetical protein